MKIQRIPIAVLLILACTTVTPAAREDAIQASYEVLYQGHSNSAYSQFRALADKEPENLGASFGVLMALYERGLQNANLQKEFEQRIDQLIEKASTRFSKTSKDTDALFYLEQGYLQRARYRADFNKGVFGAARDGIKAKSYADEYIKVDPGRVDAYLAPGLYNYYVEIIPAYFKFLRTLLFMPGGNRTEGLKQIERVVNGGGMWAPFAAENLIDIYDSYENRTAEAVKIAENLQKKYPENPQYRFILARLYSTPEFEQYERAAQLYTEIVQRVDQNHPNYKPVNRYQAILNMARIRQQQWRYDDAIKLLTPVIDSNVTQPEGLMPNFLLSRANLRALSGDASATDDIRRVLNEPKWKARHAAAQMQLQSLQQRRQSGELAVYADLMRGNRLTAEHHWDEALQEYDRVRTRHPDDWQVRYRYAYLDVTRADYTKAEAELNPIVNSTVKMPDWLKSGAMLQLARVYDIRGQRDQALRLYHKIVDNYEKEGAAQIARRGLITAYRLPSAQTGS